MSEPAFQNADALDLSDPSKIDPDDPVVVNKLYREYMSAMFVWVKSGIIFEPNNPTLHNACDRVARVANVVRMHFDSASDMEFMADGVYVNGTLLKLRGSRFDQAEYLSAVWASFGVGGVKPLDDTNRQDWLQLMAVLRLFAQGKPPAESMMDVSFDKFKLKPFDGTGPEEEVAVTERVRTLRAYCVAVISMRELVDRVVKGGRLRLAEIKRPLLELITVSEQCRDMLVSLVNLKRHKQEPHHHFVNTAALTIVMAGELGVSRDAYLELATAAVLHDLGIAVLPAFDPGMNVHEREARCAQESISHLAVAKAPFERTANRVTVANEIRLCVDRSTHNQYPFDLATTSRLVAVAHAYDLLTTPKPKRPALLPDEALRLLMAEAGRRYDDNAVRALVNVLGVYPIGSLVSLTTGQTAIVIGAQKDGDGSRPRVKLVRGANGANLGGAILDLSESLDVQIVNCLDAEEQQVNLPAFLLS